MSALHERRFSAEFRVRDEQEGWRVEERYRDVGIDFLMKEQPSPAWSQECARIADLKRGQHMRLELDDDAALILERL